MAPKGGNAKKESGRAKKAENEVCLGWELRKLTDVWSWHWHWRENRKRKRLQLKRSRRPRKLMNGSLAVRLLSDPRGPFFRGMNGTLIFSVIAKGTSKADVAAAKAAEIGKLH